MWDVLEKKEILSGFKEDSSLLRELIWIDGI